MNKHKRGITFAIVSRYRFRGNTVEQATVPAVLPQRSVPVPREIRGYRGIPVVPITVQLSTSDSLSVALYKRCSMQPTPPRSLSYLMNHLSTKWSNL